MALSTSSNFARPDDAFRAIVEAHRGLTEEQSADFDAALVLILANHIGDLNVVTLKTVNPDLSNDANLFPGMTQQKWGLSFAINTEPGPAGRSAGSLAWAGLFNTYFWLDPNKRVTGTIMTQLLPFADAPLLKLFAKFESGLYAAVA